MGLWFGHGCAGFYWDVLGLLPGRGSTCFFIFPWNGGHPEHILVLHHQRAESCKLHDYCLRFEYIPLAKASFREQSALRGAGSIFFAKWEVEES